MGRKPEWGGAQEVREWDGAHGRARVPDAQEQPPFQCPPCRRKSGRHSI